MLLLSRGSSDIFLFDNITERTVVVCREVIAVNQDKMGRQGRRVDTVGNLASVIRSIRRPTFVHRFTKNID